MSTGQRSEHWEVNVSFLAEIGTLEFGALSLRSVPEVLLTLTQATGDRAAQSPLVSTLVPTGSLEPLHLTVAQGGPSQYSGSSR